MGNQKDLAEKYLEAYPDVFADIVNGLLFRGESIIDPASLVEADNIGIYKCDNEIHETRRDIAKYIQTTISPECIPKKDILFTEETVLKICLIGLENQTSIYYLMPARCIEYDAASYRKQLNVSKDFGQRKSDKIYPVMTLVLYFGEKEWTGPLHLKACFVDFPSGLDPYINDYKIHLMDIPRLSEEEVNYFNQDERYINQTTVSNLTGREDVTMCRVMDEAINTGIEKGLLQGREEGRRAGEAIRNYQIANRYMEKFGGSFEDALNLAEISEEEYYWGREIEQKYQLQYQKK